MLGAVILICAVLVGCNAFYPTDEYQENITGVELEKKLNKL